MDPYTLTSATTLVLSMALHPEVVKEAQAELDNVVGSTHLPNITDRDHLPYIDAVTMEVLRWVSATPPGIAHCLIEDDEHQDYFMPRDTLFHSNIWAMSRDETIYEDPERFLAPGEEVLDPRLFAFGFGRRACIGRHFAESAIFMAFASILAAFDISKAIDENGREVEPKPGHTVQV